MGSFSYTSTGRFVIAVAGPSGAGKSTLVKELVQELEDAIALSFDDYHPSSVSSTSYPKDLAQWLAKGANPDDCRSASAAPWRNYHTTQQPERSRTGHIYRARRAVWPCTYPAERAHKLCYSNKYASRSCACPT